MNSNRISAVVRLCVFACCNWAGQGKVVPIKFEHLDANSEMGKLWIIIFFLFFLRRHLLPPIIIDSNSQLQFDLFDRALLSCVEVFCFEYFCLPLTPLPHPSPQLINPLNRMHPSTANSLFIFSVWLEFSFLTSLFSRRSRTNVTARRMQIYRNS